MAEKLINKKYKVTAQILTPLHIGAGSEKDWVEGMDYIIRDGYLWHLDMNKMHVAGVDMNKLSALFETGNAKEVKNIIGSKFKDVSDFHITAPNVPAREIKSFLRNQLTNRPLLVGSSLKGAIRSILFNYLTDNGHNIERKDRFGKDKDSRQLNEEVFGNLNDGTEYMRYIRVGDFELPQNSTELVNTKIFNLDGGQGHWTGGWKHKGGKEGETTTTFMETGFNTVYECLPFGAKADGKIMIADKLFNNFIAHNQKRSTPKIVSKEDTKMALVNSPISELCKLINKYTRKYVEKEQAFFSKYSQAEYSDYLCANEEDFSGATTLMLGELDNLQANQCILKMSAGAGFHAITGDWQFDDYFSGILDQKRNKQGVKPKSRKIAITHDDDDLYLDLMGFVKLTFVEE